MSLRIAPHPGLTPAQRVMTIVPEGGRLIAEVQLANRDVGFVRAGQPVKVKIETFSFTRYGLIDGRVLSVSRTVAAHDERAAQSAVSAQADASPDAPPKGSPTYAARVALDRTQMMIDGRSESLQPGMAVTAEIRTGRRTILDYLFSPLARRSQESLHER